MMIWKLTAAACLAGLLVIAAAVYNADGVEVLAPVEVRYE